MKRLCLMIAVVLSLFVLAPAANANVFFDNPDTELDVKFKGVEYIFGPDGAVVANADEVIAAADPTVYIVQGIFYVDSIQIKDGDNLYQSNNDNAYVGVLSGLSIKSIIVGEGGAPTTIYFSGGTIDWYYTESLSRDIMINARWDEATGTWYSQNGERIEIVLNEEDRFLSYSLAYNGLGDGYATAVTNPDGTISASFFAYGDIVEVAGLDPWKYDYFDSNLYDGHDMFLHATLDWGEDGERFFRVNDPAMLTTAATPEPGTLVLMSVGLLLSTFYVRRQQKNGM